MNPIDGLDYELLRAKELLKIYEGIPTGGFGAAIIKQTIKDAEVSIQMGDVVEMVKAYKKLERLE